MRSPPKVQKKGKATTRTISEATCKALLVTLEPSLASAVVLTQGIVLSKRTRAWELLNGLNNVEIYAHGLKNGAWHSELGEEIFLGSEFPRKLVTGTHEPRLLGGSSDFSPGSEFLTCAFAVELQTIYSFLLWFCYLIKGGGSAWSSLRCWRFGAALAGIATTLLSPRRKALHQRHCLDVPGEHRPERPLGLHL